ncbi:MAG TPA: crosslink repair DNA glycosylase YcaQ family protein [Symbiobacteriaceae bacterium]|nr:crosslink repair DNA glycosylase YcaQ family protein [Symbiobacteriaceae bacterium]
MPVPPALIASRGQVLAFRLDSHHLTERLPPGSLLRAAAACGLQDSPPGSAALALHARVARLTPTDVVRALAVDKTLVTMWSMRGSPYLFPARDAAPFTLGLLPEDEASLRFFLLGMEQGLERMGMSATEVVAHTELAVHHVLDGRVVSNKQQLDHELAGWVARRLTAVQLAVWNSPSPYAENQSLGEALVSFALRPLSLQGRICFAPRTGTGASFVRFDQWVGEPMPAAHSQQARAELVRRYLRCYGPSTSGHFAEWAGISPAQAGRMWRLVAHLAAIRQPGRSDI